MSQQLFREFIVLFKHWPIDATKAGSCLGEQLRKHFSQHFKKGELSENINVKHWTKIYHDLNRILNNEYKLKYPRAKAIGSLGLGKEQCKLVLSNQAKKFFEK